MQYYFEVKYQQNKAKLTFLKAKNNLILTIYYIINKQIYKKQNVKNDFNIFSSKIYQ